MKILIHDVEQEQLNELISGNIDLMTFIPDHEIHPCIGCFGCWIKKPGACVIRDHYGDIGEEIGKCDELIIISKCYYGGFSPFVKNVLDRGISCNLPYFEIRNGEMHHKRRYDNHFTMKVWFYGEGITEQEKATAQKLVKANAINLDCSHEKAIFVRELSEIKSL